MGEREITEHVEVSEQQEVHVCDFCGRSSEEFDSTFNDVYVNPDIEVSTRRWVDSYEDGCKIIRGMLADESELYVGSDMEKHYCNECATAHIEVHNDNN